MFHYPAPFSDTKQEYRCAAYPPQVQRFFRFPICTNDGNRKAAADHRPFLQRSKYDIFCFFHFPSRCNIFSFPFPLFLCCRAFTGPFSSLYQTIVFMQTSFPFLQPLKRYGRPLLLYPLPRLLSCYALTVPLIPRRSIFRMTCRKSYRNLNRYLRP